MVETKKRGKNGETKKRKLVWQRKSKAEDFKNIEIGDWIEGVGFITTNFEKDFIRHFGKLKTMAAKEAAVEL